MPGWEVERLEGQKERRQEQENKQASWKQPEKLGDKQNHRDF